MDGPVTALLAMTVVCSFNDLLLEIILVYERNLDDNCTFRAAKYH